MGDFLYSLVKTSKEVNCSMSRKPITACAAQDVQHVRQRVCYHLEALKDARLVFWDLTCLFWEKNIEDTASPQAVSWHRLHVVWLKEQKAVAHYTVHKHEPGANNNRPVHLLQKQDNSYSKSESVKRLEETGTPPWSIRGNLFNEALTDGMGLKAHPEPTQRLIGSTLTIYTTVTTPTGNRWR